MTKIQKDLIVFGISAVVTLTPIVIKKAKKANAEAKYRKANPVIKLKKSQYSMGTVTLINA